MEIKIKMHSVLDTPHGKEIVCSEERESRICEAFKPYDLNMNRIVAGLMGATCYMPDTFDKLNSKTEEQVLRIAEIVESNFHHSTFGHSFVTLEITGIPKALAMVLNNEHDYNTSEKSARYTIMKDVAPDQKELYDKWTRIFKAEIEKRYPNGSNPFFDEAGKKAQKLAQENARYMISVFTPTNMVYTVSFRQLNYIAHWMEYQIAHPDNAFYEAMQKEMKEFKKYSLFVVLGAVGLGLLAEILVYLIGEPVMTIIFGAVAGHKYHYLYLGIVSGVTLALTWLISQIFVILGKNNSQLVSAVISVIVCIIVSLVYIDGKDCNRMSIVLIVSNISFVISSCLMMKNSRRVI